MLARLAAPLVQSIILNTHYLLWEQLPILEIKRGSYYHVLQAQPVFHPTYWKVELQLQAQTVMAMENSQVAHAAVY